MPATGENGDVGACVGSVSLDDGGAVIAAASDMDTFRFLRLEEDTVGLRIENPNVPKTLLFLRECRGVVNTADGDEETSDSETGVGSSLPSVSMGGMTSVRLLDLPLPHQVPIHSPTDERSDLVLAWVSILGAVRLEAAIERASLVSSSVRVEDGVSSVVAVGGVTVIRSAIIGV